MGRRKSWGFSFVCEEASEHTLNHEFGHAIQNMLYGPFFIFLVAIPSGIRYQLITRKIIKVKDYDDIWFERQATNWGYRYVDLWEKNK